jgi:hypothetical protein
LRFRVKASPNGCRRRANFFKPQIHTIQLPTPDFI